MVKQLVSERTGITYIQHSDQSDVFTVMNIALNFAQNLLQLGRVTVSLISQIKEQDVLVINIAKAEAGPISRAKVGKTGDLLLQIDFLFFFFFSRECLPYAQAVTCHLLQVPLAGFVKMARGPTYDTRPRVVQYASSLLWLKSLGFPYEVLG
jgi:hypothetical protein